MLKMSIGTGWTSAMIYVSTSLYSNSNPFIMKSRYESESGELHQKSLHWNEAIRYFLRISVREIEIFVGVQDLFREALFPE